MDLVPRLACVMKAIRCPMIATAASPVAAAAAAAAADGGGGGGS
jgi:hypothetical protein